MYSEKEVTIYDIAKRLDLSATTVSRGLKDNPAISKKTKKRITDVAVEMGYRFNTFASNLRSKRTNTIGVIIPRMNSSFMSDVLAGMEKVANEANYNLIISQSLESADKEAVNIKTMFNNRVDGLMVSVAYNTNGVSQFEMLLQKGVPVLFFDRTLDHPMCPGIIIDNQKSGYLATRHLLDQGCKNIIHITGNQERNVYSERQKGYESALAEAGIELNKDQTFVTMLDEQAGIDCAEQILKMSPLPDGVFVDNDNCAANCMMKLMDSGIKIPEDIAFIGFNNDPISKIIRPALSTISYPGVEMGQIAARKLISHLNGQQNINSTNSIVLRSELIVRDSSLCNRL
ncbi:LacI family DNA-binding transcriptional regulator [Pedobacter frigoris]|uniref:LacI family transcriptional regulator n=1 Tax=Pedobacter frigoris TaxID=2571272 RepID=A0A4U1CNJ6_9SPHI|nr:LacI family DNA-binding transcriptional regulator [Pedobacter frigoris]TKC06974.1 LacI family transcriptional regulator [Pedobacter frigoris]